MSEPQKIIEVYADTRGFGTCKGPQCGARLTWYETLTGKRMCFTGDPVPLTTRHHEQSGRLIEAMDFEASHWRTCPNWHQFKRRP